MSKQQWSIGRFGGSLTYHIDGKAIRSEELRAWKEAFPAEEHFDPTLLSFVRGFRAGQKDRDDYPLQP